MPNAKARCRSRENIMSMVMAVKIPHTVTMLAAAFCRFTAKVLELRQNYALVAYDELQDEENEQEQLREWFPMDPERSLNASDVPKGFACHKRKGFVLRPRPDQQARLHLKHKKIPLAF